jgi:pimeloyl-ACP methyl ester carboxylesterase
MLRDVNTTVSIPLVVSRAAVGDYGPLDRAGAGSMRVRLDLMGRSIWCNEPWVGLDATGPWGTDFDSYTTAFIAGFRQECRAVPKRVEPSSLWRLPISSRVPVLALQGGADPQDPITNLRNFKQHFHDSRIVVLPHQGHDFSFGSACDEMLAEFVDRETTKGLDTTACIESLVVPPFEMPN